MYTAVKIEMKINLTGFYVLISPKSHMFKEYFLNRRLMNDMMPGVK